MKKVNGCICATYENAVFYKEKLWFTELDCNELYCYDIVNKKSELICKIESEQEYKNRLFGAIVPYKEYLCLIPFSANNVYMVHIEKRTVKTIELQIPDKNTQYDYLEYAKFLSAHQYSNNIYLMPVSYPAIIEINCNTKEVKYYDSWIESVRTKFDNIGNVYFRKTMLQENIIYAPFCGINAVLKFNVITKEIEIIKVGKEECTYSAIDFDGENYWLAPREDGPIVCWNEFSDECKKHKNYPNSYKKVGVTDLKCIGDKVLLLPLKDSNPIILKKKTGEIVELKIDEDTGYMVQNMVNENIYLCSIRSGCIYILNEASEVKEIIHIQLPEKEELYHRKWFTNSYQIFKGNRSANSLNFYEEYGDSLKDYLQYVDAEIHKSEKQKNTNNLYGKNIWKSVCAK